MIRSAPTIRGSRAKWPLARTVNWEDVPESNKFTLRDAVGFWLMKSGRENRGSVMGDWRGGMVSIDPKVAFTIWPRGPKEWPFSLRKPSEARFMATSGQSKNWPFWSSGVPFYDPAEDWAEFSAWRGGKPKSPGVSYYSSLVRPFPVDEEGIHLDLKGGPYPGYGPSPQYFRDHKKRLNLSLDADAATFEEVWNGDGYENWREEQLANLFIGLERYISVILGKHIRGMRRMAMLGSGSFATGFMMFRDESSSGKVLKLTSDAVDIVACHRIAGVNLKNVVYVKKAGIIEGLRFYSWWYQNYLGFMGFMVVQELLPLNEVPFWKEQPGFKELTDFQDILFYEGTSLGTRYAVEEMLRDIHNGVQRAKIRFETASPSIRQKLAGSIKFNMDVAKGMEQLMPYKVYATDLHHENVGYDPVSDNYKLMDIGLSLSEEFMPEYGEGNLDTLVRGEGDRIFLENSGQMEAWLKATRQIERGGV